MEPSIASSWSRLAAYVVLSEHTPMAGFRMLAQLAFTTDCYRQLISTRATKAATLDPELGELSIRANLGLLSAPAVSAVYALPGECWILLDEPAMRARGASATLRDYLLSRFSARAALLLGCEINAECRLFEFPDAGAVRKAFSAVYTSVAEQTQQRAAFALVEQLIAQKKLPPGGSPEAFAKPAALLERHGVNIASLPIWWRNGLLGVRTQGPTPKIIESLGKVEDLLSALPL